MRGDERIQDEMFSCVTLEQRVPQDHPLREIRKLTDTVLVSLNDEFDSLYSASGVLRSRRSTCCGHCCCRSSTRFVRNGSWSSSWMTTCCSAGSSGSAWMTRYGTMRCSRRTVTVFSGVPSENGPHRTVEVAERRRRRVSLASRLLKTHERLHNSG